MKTPIDDLLNKWKIEKDLQAKFNACKTSEERKAFLKSIRSSLNPVDVAISTVRPEWITGIRVA